MASFNVIFRAIRILFCNINLCFDHTCLRFLDYLPHRWNPFHRASRGALHFYLLRLANDVLNPTHSLACPLPFAAFQSAPLSQQQFSLILFLWSSFQFTWFYSTSGCFCLYELQRGLRRKVILETIKLDLNISANFGTTSNERFLLLTMHFCLLKSFSFTYSLNSSGLNELPIKKVMTAPYIDFQAIPCIDWSHSILVASSFLLRIFPIKT